MSSWLHKLDQGAEWRSASGAQEEIPGGRWEQRGVWAGQRKPVLGGMPGRVSSGERTSPGGLGARGTPDLGALERGIRKLALVTAEST